MNRPKQPTVPIDSEALARDVAASYAAEARTRHTDAASFPQRPAVAALLEKLRVLFFPGFWRPQPLPADQLKAHAQQMVDEVHADLKALVEQAAAASGQTLAAGAGGTATRFLEAVPRLREALALDVQAAYDGDPAARDTDECVLCYPGVLAIFTHRIAHALHTLEVPLLPRLMSEQVHSETGIDIHPGASIGHSFFIDHGTGVVIGETTQIGDRVKIYQGVTLGAMSFSRDASGRLIRGTKRHPTLEDDVTIYANATVLGGRTEVGKGCIIGASVFLTKSVPPGHYVTLKGLDLRYRSAELHNRLVTGESGGHPGTPAQPG